MIRKNNYITALLVIIVIMLLIGLFVAIYYVLELDWFKQNKQVNLYQEKPLIQQVVKNEIKYDITKREYNIALYGEEFKVIVYKDGSVGVTMMENEMNGQVKIYNEILNKEIKLDINNIVRAYEVYVANDATQANCILLLDKDGNLYRLSNSELMTNGKYSFNKIEGLAKIIDVKPITNDGLVENATGINAIAIDEESNELLLTNYLLNK